MGLHVTYPLFLTGFNENFYYLSGFLKNAQISNFMTSVQWEPSCSIQMATQQSYIHTPQKYIYIYVCMYVCIILTHAVPPLIPLNVTYTLSITLSLSEGMLIYTWLSNCHQCVNNICKCSYYGVQAIQ